MDFISFIAHASPNANLSNAKLLHRLATNLQAYLLISVILLTLSLQALADTQNQTSIHSQSQSHNVLVLGDSISAAYGIATTDGWVQLLQNRLDAQNEKETLDYQIFNASISGETTAGGLARLPKLLHQQKPDTVIIELGGNDGLRGFPIQTLRKNLSALITNAKQSGANVLLIGMQIPPNYGARYNKMFKQSFVQAAEQLNVQLAPSILENIAIHKELMQADGIHPTAAAQMKILDNVMPYLTPLLQQQ